jgi:hypothetical protein
MVHIVYEPDASVGHDRFVGGAGRIDPPNKGFADLFCERLGIADRNGKRIRKDLPKDMPKGADRDFGG